MFFLKMVNVRRLPRIERKHELTSVTFGRCSVAGRGRKPREPLRRDECTCPICGQQTVRRPNGALLPHPSEQGLCYGSRRRNATIASAISIAPRDPADESGWGVDATCPVCCKDVEVVLGGIEKLANHMRGEQWCRGSGTRIVPGEWKKRTTRRASPLPSATTRRASPLPSATTRERRKSDTSNGHRTQIISQAADAGLTEIELHVGCPTCGQLVRVERQLGAALRAQHQNLGSACSGSRSIVPSEELVDVEAFINAKIRMPPEQSSSRPGLSTYHDDFVTEEERAHLMSRPRQYDQ